MIAFASGSLITNSSGDSAFVLTLNSKATPSIVCAPGVGLPTGARGAGLPFGPNPPSAWLLQSRFVPGYL
jgi:hypothetical protein